MGEGDAELKPGRFAAPLAAAPGAAGSPPREPLGAYRQREPSLSGLFPQSPGDWTLNDLNLHSLGLPIRSRDEVANVKKVEVLTVIKGDNVHSPEKNSKVAIHYIAWYSNRVSHGKMWDSTYNRGAPLRFRMGCGAVFAGLEEAVAQLTVGQKVLAYIPPTQAFGKRGFLALVPPDSHVMLWICLIECSAPP